MAGDVAKTIAKRTKALEKSISDEEQRKRLTKVGVAMKPLAQRAAVADLGADGAFSGWRRGAPIPLQVAFKLHSHDAAMTVHRQGRSAGPWRVAEEGRGAGMSRGRKGGARRRSKVTGEITVSVAKASRKVGATDGKDTWSDAVGLMQKKAPDLMLKLNRAATMKAFTGGSG